MVGIPTYSKYELNFSLLYELHIFMIRYHYFNMISTWYVGLGIAVCPPFIDKVRKRFSQKDSLNYSRYYTYRGEILSIRIQ